MIRAIIIDDEQVAGEKLKNMLLQFPHIQVTGVYTDSVKGLEACMEQDADAVFLDIEMPVMGGFEIAGQLANYKADMKIIFATAFDEYAVKAFELNSLDYLLKPVTPERLAVTADRLEKAGMQQVTPEKIHSAMKSVNAKINKVVISEKERITILEPQDIFFFTTEENGVNVVTQKGIYVARETLSYWEEKMFDFDFFRCHKSFLVNLHKIKEVHTMFNNTFLIKLEGNKTEIPVSRRYAAQLRQILGA